MTSGAVTSAIYACQECFTLWGTDTRVCQGNNVWAGTMPYCSKMFKENYYILLYIKKVVLIITRNASHFCNGTFQFPVLTLCTERNELTNQAGHTTEATKNNNNHSHTTIRYQRHSRGCRVCLWSCYYHHGCATCLASS